MWRWNKEEMEEKQWRNREGTEDVRVNTHKSNYV